MVPDDGEKHSEPLVTYHPRILRKELGYLEIHDSSVIGDLDYIIGMYSISPWSVPGRVLTESDSHFLIHGEEEERQVKFRHFFIQAFGFVGRSKQTEETNRHSRRHDPQICPCMYWKFDIILLGFSMPPRVDT